MTEAERQAQIQAHIAVHGVVRIPRKKMKGESKYRASTPSRLRNQVKVGCPCCGGKLDKVHNQHMGTFSVCNNGSCPARVEGCYYSISVTKELDWKKLVR